MHPFRTLATLLATLSAIGLTTGLAHAGGIPSTTATVSGSQYATVHSPRNTYFHVYNDDFGASTSLKVHGLGFQVVHSSASDFYGAYPNISSGWQWGRYTTGSPGAANFAYPVQVRREGEPRTSVRVRLGPGRYNAAYDIWFSKTAKTPVMQNDGTELMIWFVHPGLKTHTDRVVTLDGVRWDVMAWTMFHNGVHWHYVAYVAHARRTAMSGSLVPFFADAIRHGALSLNWYLTAIDFGFELVQNGKGNAVTSYSLTGVK